MTARTIIDAMQYPYAFVGYVVKPVGEGQWLPLKAFLDFVEGLANLNGGRYDGTVSDSKSMLNRAVFQFYTVEERDSFVSQLKARKPTTEIWIDSPPPWTNDWGSPV